MSNAAVKNHFMRMYNHTVRDPNGYSITMGYDGKITERDTQQCCHCGGHFEVVAGSGKVRGFCTLCNKVTCGQPVCHEHFPIEKRMEYYEKGKMSDLMDPLDTVAAPKKFIIGV